MTDEELRAVYLAGIRSSVEEFGEFSVEIVMKFAEDRLPDSHGLRAVFDAGLKLANAAKGDDHAES